MINQFSLNLPVADLPKSLAFFQALGFALNPAWSNDAGACVILNETIFVMLTTHPKFREFTPKGICDPTKEVEALFCLGCASRQVVDDLVARALAAGGSTYDQPEDFGFMYTHSFVDLDGHGWGLYALTEAPAAES